MLPRISQPFLRFSCSTIVLEFVVAFVRVLGSERGEQCANGNGFGETELVWAAYSGRIVVAVKDGDLDLCTDIMASVEHANMQEEAILALC